MDAFCAEVSASSRRDGFVIGLYDALRTLLGAVYAYPGGVLVDFGDIDTD